MEGPVGPLVARLPDHLRPGPVIARRRGATLVAGRDRLSGRDVVIKLLEGPGAALRVEVEARALARLGPHPHVLEVLAVGVDGSRSAWVVTAHADGGALTAAAGRPVAELVGWASEVAAAIAHAHSRGVVHGDVTPSNILLARRGPSGTQGGARSVALLADFGSAVIDGAPSGGPGWGHTPAYAAPERCRGGPPTESSDVYGLARSVLAVSGEEALSQLPDRCRRVLRRALSDEPAARPTAAALRRGLR